MPKVLVVCQYYHPEPFRITDICEELARRGYEVAVLTGEPNYPEGVIYPGYEGHQRSDEVINEVKVHRCPIVPRKTGAAYRMLNYYSFPRSVSKYIKSGKCVASDGKPYDLVFVNQLSPVMMAQPAIEYKKLYKVPLVLYCLDLWPESLVAGGITRKSAVYKYYHGVSGKIYRACDRILVTSRNFAEYMQSEFGIAKNKTGYLPQYAEDLFSQLPAKEPGESFDLVFAGNIGAAQSVDTVLYAADRLRNDPVKFHIVGGGIKLEELKELSKKLQLPNVEFYGRLPLEDMPKFYSMADAMLVTLQADPLLSQTLPGKVQSYMAAGKPIIGSADGETASVINASGCGLCGKAEDAGELAENIKRFIYGTGIASAGKKSKEYYESNFSRASFYEKLCSEFDAQMRR